MRPALAELEADELSPDPRDSMTPCPHGCGAYFHGESVAYVTHVNNTHTDGSPQ